MYAARTVISSLTFEMIFEIWASIGKRWTVVSIKYLGVICKI